MNNNVCIYEITSPSGKIYIGQSRNIRKRFSNYKNLRCKRQPFLFNSLKKYSFENHIIEILHFLPSDTNQDILDNYEKLYIEQYRDCGFEMMNLKEGGISGRHLRSWKLSIETKEKMRRNKLLPENSSRQSNFMKGNKINVGRKRSEEEIEKVRQRMIGNKFSLGNKQSEETKKKRVQSRKRKKDKSKEIRRFLRGLNPYNDVK